MAKETKLFPFKHASLCIEPMPIIPEIYKLTVTGEATSFDPTIKLIKKGINSEGYLIVELVGHEGAAIGQKEFNRNLSISIPNRVKGVIVVGEGNRVELNKLSASSCAFTFSENRSFEILELQSEPLFDFEPTLTLRLKLDTWGNTVTGTAIIQVLHDTIITSDLFGTYRQSFEGLPDNLLELELSGTPEIHWPPHVGIGPVIPKNFKGTVSLLNDNSGRVKYQYRTNILDQHWNHADQKIRIINPYQKPA